MTATSGPGLSLKSENIGLAIMGEVPLVIVDVQRLGPATGGATTVGQGDVNFIRWGTAGGYPVIALAPSTIPECYWLTQKAFDLAERFRCPVFLVTDKELNLTTGTVDADAWQRIEVRPRTTWNPKSAAGTPFAPYRYSPADQVPAMAHYGDGELVRFTGSTHDEQAVITKNPPVVERLNRHLVEKIERHRDEIELVDADLEIGARTLFLSFGVTAGAMREAISLARRSGRKVSSITIHSLWPVPERAITEALAGIDRLVVAELNLGQYKDAVAPLAGTRDLIGLNRIDGELLAPERFLEVLR